MVTGDAPPRPSELASASAAESQPSLRRMREFGVRPKRELGQNFLIDSNMLGVIERAAELGRDDVVLEIGGGLGVLSEHLAPLVAHLHVVELDRGSRPRCATRSTRSPTSRCTSPTPCAWTCARCDPAPTKVVANLPYGIAAGAILRTIEDLDGVTRWVGMVQKEVGERFAAAPGSGAYGVPSVLAQLACDVQVLRGVSRSVFAPVPNVDSVLVGLRRTGPGGRAGPARARLGGVRPPPQGARGLARPGARRAARASASGRGTRSPSSATRETCAPSACRRRTFACCTRS